MGLIPYRKGAENAADSEYEATESIQWNKMKATIENTKDINSSNEILWTKTVRDKFYIVI